MSENQKSEASQPTVIIQQQSSNPFQMGNNSGNGFDIRDILFLCLSRWWWFVLSFLICGVVAWFQIRTTPEVFSRTAKLMIKSDGKESIGGVADGLSAVGINKNYSSISNELIALKAPSIYVELVRQLGLNTSYSRTGRLLDKDLYGAGLPVKVEFLDLNDRDYARLTLKLDGQGGVSMYNQSYAGQTSEEPVPVSFDDTIPSLMGRIIVSRCPSYTTGNLFEIHVNRVSVYDMAGACSSRLSVWAPEESSIIDITYYDTSIQRAEDVINTVINLYNQNWVKDRNQVAIATSKFIGERLDMIESELCDVEDEIYDFKSNNLLPDEGTNSGAFVGQSIQSDLQIEDLNTQLYMCRYVRNYVSDPANASVLLPANTGIGSGTAESQIGQYNSLLMTRNEILSQSSLRNPVVREYDKKLEEQRQVILASLDNQMQVINSQINSTLNRHQQSNRKLASAHDQSKYLQRIQRQQKVKEQLYTYLLQKREETELNQAFIAYNSRLISAPSGSFSPVSPDTKKIKTTAAAIGFAIPFVIILILYLMNTKVRGRKDVDKINVPFVGELPNVERTKSELKKYAVHSVLEVKSDNKNMINEAFRIIRSNLAFIVGPNSKDKSKIVMVTSINAGSGKTFIMANLAASFAISGKKVLVLDLDLRKRSISKYVGRPKAGISTFLSGQTDDWRSCVVPMQGYDNLYMMPAGRTSPNPSELLQSDLLEQMLQEAKQEYDYIFLDCPPAEIVADATIIKRLAEVTLFVVRVGVMERSHLPVVEQYYKEKTFNNLCLILNGSEALHSRYGYYRYGYGYSYGYGYGYGYGYNYGYGYYGEKETKKDSDSDSES